MKGSCLINSSIVLGLRIIGKGFSAGKKLCAFLGLPFLSKLAFRNQERKLLNATERVAQENINAALSEIKGSNSFTKCGISIDGTWQRRGYSSLNGCASAISVDTGHIIENNKLFPSPSKTKSVVNYLEPKTTKEVQRFLSLTGYFRKFIPAYSVIAKRLSDLLRKDTPFNFDVKQKASFDE
ncbi:uncharacterized protein TNCV_412351 [Trichonephila clavipes]|uniref:Mutator-like transposase domain-containing protein n=1 Tax=Trichonephila clavipes TaxID=2585209 RepID=A0A8X6VHR4_TRICX|nr:uncharacterized protein TNCV_412351 [Trichonephila clavipes]